MADRPPEQLSPENLSRSAARAAAGRVRDSWKAETHEESLHTAAAHRITQAQRDAARAHSSTTASSTATRATQRQQQAQRPSRSVL
jgi:hypothetical protein